MYKLFNNIENTAPVGVIRTSDGASIPFDPANSDYQAFLLWKSEGNEPTPADSE
jgi:hypothetical protein